MGSLQKRAVIYGITTSLLLSSCASLERYRDASDTCHPYRQTLIQTDEDYKARLAKYALAGVASAAAAVVLLKAAGVDNPMVLAATGIAVGLGPVTYAYFSEKAKREKTLQGVQQAIDSDAGAFRAELGTVGSAIHHLSECRNSQINIVRERYQRKQIDRAMAQAELTRVETKVAEDRDLVNTVLGRVDERADVFVKAKATSLETPVNNYLQQVSTYNESETVEMISSQASKRLDQTDELKVHRVLEYNPTGKSETWLKSETNQRVSVTPIRTYEKPSGPCRDYQVTVIVSGKTEIAHGSACRQPDGTWVSVAKKPIESRVAPEPTIPPLKKLKGTYYLKQRGNLRAGSSTDAPVVATVDKGTAIEMIGKTGNWFVGTHQGKRIYVHSNLVSSTKPQEAPEAPPKRGPKPPIQNPKDEVQHVYNDTHVLRQETQAGREETQRLIEQTNILLG